VRVFVHFGLLLPLVSVAWAQTANIQKLGVSQENTSMRIEVTLSSPVTPRISLATKPDRLVLEFADTSPGIAPVSTEVKQQGVKSVRIEHATGAPPATRIIVLLERARPYGISTQGSKIVLTLLPPEDQTASARNRRGPVAGASVPILDRIHRKPEASIPAANTAPPPTPVPPHSLPPIQFPSDQSPAAASNSTAGAMRPPIQASAEGSIHGGNSPSTPQSATASPSAQGSPPNVEAEPGTQDVAGTLQPANPDVHIAFRVKYVAEGVAYLEGGRNDGLSEGMKLEVKGLDPSEKPTASASADAQPVAELQVASVALSSAVGEIHNPTRTIKVGDWAYLSSEDTQALIAQRSLSATRKYPVVVSFSEGDTLDDEARVVIPRPPLPEVNRARGRIGFDYSGVASHEGSGGLSSNAGLMIRTDITRINGTYWNLNGFWRGRINNQSHGGQATLQDLINRTYTIGMTYDNPNSKFVAGVGRLYLPWATSLDSIDGGYFGRRLSSGVTAGIFAGSSPDPTSWSYNPDRRIGGAFVNFDGGSFDNLRYTSTSGMGLSMLKWNIDRPFVFFEN